MSSDSKNLTNEQKAAIVLKAASLDADGKQELAKEQGVTVKEIENWTRDSKSDSVKEDETFTLETSDKYAESVEFGADPDKLNYPRLIFWSTFGTAVITIMILSIMAIYQYTFTGAGVQQSEASQSYRLTEIQQKDSDRLNTFGVIDPDEGIYRIPIDSAITLIAQESIEE